MPMSAGSRRSSIGIPAALLTRRLGRRRRFGWGSIRCRLMHYASFAERPIAQNVSHVLEPLIDEIVDCAGLVDCSGSHSGQSLDAAIDSIYRVDVKFAALDCSRGLRL